MRPDVVDQEILLQSPESARWVLSGDYFLDGFQFRLDETTVSRSDNCCYGMTGQEILYGQGVLKLGLPVGCLKQVGSIKYFESGAFLIGIAQKGMVPESLESTSLELYEEILKLVGNRSISRIWNYVPEINEVHPGLIENYKLFCSGRSKAFEMVFGKGDLLHFPAASATGTRSNLLTIVFIATRSDVENWENPEQTPAYLYPAEYGPRAPSFARASRFTEENGNEWIFVSGTSAIKGSESQHEGNFSKQLNLTLRNIEIILQKCGLRLTGESARKRCFTVFLRNKSDLEELLSRMNEVMGAEDSILVVEGDICRRNLAVEIELTVIPD